MGIKKTYLIDSTKIRQVRDLYINNYKKLKLLFSDG
jgi:hypothetical protein